ncbi:beta-galactosidase-1-like protein 2 isoform X1 [Lytechinus pictus]|uniref:beta-galactosidase-1-like protein 2 isoform X1 n=1 Tax=Lytechinus pictus TaxID=7653 RepID=UPI0030B9F1D3
MTVSIRGVHLLRWLVLIGMFALMILWYFQRNKNLQLDYMKSLQEPSLKLQNGEFVLNGEEVTILSGSMHYFRVVPEYWEDRLRKMKSGGLNTVTTYVPWNLHEQVRGDFDFSGILNVVEFLKIAQKVGLYVIFRPGPYICAEWELGGLPSWLLADDEMKVRTTYPLFTEAVTKYFDHLIPKVVPLQYNRGGPIIAFQVENEYGSYGDSAAYMEFVKEAMVTKGVTELLVTSDNSKKAMKKGRLPGVLMTANFQDNVERHFGDLKALQGDNLPLMTMEFWSGWFDHWGERHHIYTADGIAELTKSILVKGASINFYMYHGGTNFGFMNGGNIDKGIYKPTITSYDYDAPLSESGEPTEKFFKIKEVIQKHTPTGRVPSTLPELPVAIGKVAYSEVKVQETMSLAALLEISGKPIYNDDILAMEKLPINNGGGQSFGFLLYRSRVNTKPTKLTLSRSPRDRAQVFLNGDEVGVLMRKTEEEDRSLELTNGKDANNVLDILVENLGRVNYDKDIQTEKKGLLGDVMINDKKQVKWEMYPLEFTKHFMEAVSTSKKWSAFEGREKQPALYRATLEIQDSKPKDTFVNMKGWEKGVIFINGFNLGRYWNVGPQKNYYLPGPLLRQGKNEIIMFELHKADGTIRFDDKADLGEEQQINNEDDIEPML